MSRLSLHLQSCPSWVPQFIERAGVQWIKWIDPPEQGLLLSAALEPLASDEELREVRATLAIIRAATVGELKVIGRTYEPDNVSNDRIWQGAAGAHSWFNKWLPFYLARTWVHAWEAPNEPQPMHDSQFRACLNEFTVTLAQLMHGVGLRLVGMNWGVGWPDTADDCRQLGPGVQACDYLGLHEYSAPTMMTEESWLCLRYRRTVAALEAAGYRVPPILVTECGIDGGVYTTTQPGKAWKTFCGGDFSGCYLPQLAWYSGEIQRDNVAAAFIFTAGSNQDWLDFDIGEAEARDLADWIAQDEPPPPPPPGELARGIDVSYWQCEDKAPIDWQAVKASGISFVFIRASVGASIDKYWETNYAGATAAGLLVGAYHYLTMVDGQAGTFARAVAGKKLPLGCWCDIEAADLTAAKCANFFQYADPQIEQPISIYTSASKFDRYGTPVWAADRLLWVADWQGNLEPILPMAWDEWEFWQQTSDGAVPGIEGRVDLNVYAGTPEQLYSAYGNGEEPYMDVKVFDASGVERDWAWVVEQYGPLDIREAEPWTMPDGTKQVLRLIELREKLVSAAVCVVHVRDVNGNPLVGEPGMAAGWYYSTAPLLPAGLNPPTSVWEPRADTGQLDGEGKIGFAMSADSTYYPDRNEAGPYGTWILSTLRPCDGYFGIGCKAGTEHAHLEPIFQVVITDDDPEPPPPPPPLPEDELARIAAATERIADALESIDAKMPFAWPTYTVQPGPPINTDVNITWAADTTS